MATSSKNLSILISTLLFATLLYQSSSHSNNPSIFSHRTIASLQQRNRNQIPSCSQMVSRSQCSQNPKCRWCQSEVLDDMCFTKTEALRLPRQLFICARVLSTEPDL